jgi:hypothetical protein
VEIHPSARKHGISDEAIAHAFMHTIVWVEVGDDPIRVLLAGPDSAGNILELVVMIGEEVELVIHAMPLRRATAEALFGGEE